MSEHSFEVGDTVQLKSGGPRMTYGGEDATGQAMCTWFEGDKMQTAMFNHGMIEKAEKPRTSGTLNVNTRRPKLGH